MCSPGAGKALTAGASAAAPGPRGDALRGRGEPPRAGPRRRPRPRSGQARPGERPRREGSASPSGGQGGGRRGRSACPPRARSCGSAAETQEAGPGTRSGQGWGARGTHQLQCAEADERAAPGAAAHGAGGVRAARAAGDPRLPAPPPPGSGAAPARRLPARPRPRLARPRPPLGAVGSALARRLC